MKEAGLPVLAGRRREWCYYKGSWCCYYLLYYSQTDDALAPLHYSIIEAAFEAK